MLAFNMVYGREPQPITQAMTFPFEVEAVFLLTDETGDILQEVKSNLL
jgi:hypothetical protein